MIADHDDDEPFDAAIGRNAPLDLRSQEQALRLAKAFERLTYEQREYAIRMFEDYVKHICDKEA